MCAVECKVKSYENSQTQKLCGK